MTFAAIITFIRGPWGRLGLLLLAVIAIALSYAWAFKQGVAHEQKAQEARVAAAKQHVTKVNAKGTSIATEVKQQHDQAVAKIEWRTKTIIEKVPYYVTVQADSRCTVPAGFVSLWNQAATGSAEPAPTPGGNDAPSGVQLSDVLTADVENYGIAHSLRAEVIAWRTWYSRLRAEWATMYATTPTPTP